MVVAKKFTYARVYDGIPVDEDYVIVEEELPALKDGEYLAEALYISVDPYLRVFPNVVGETAIGTQVAKIIESKSSKYPVGKYVVGNFGWRTHTISKDHPRDAFGWSTPTLLPFEADDVPSSLALGVLGMPGNTAYFGFLEVCRPKAGETVVVSGAAGAVGSHVGQIAKIKGCTAIGIAGSDEKGAWLKTLGYDHVINYKTQDIAESLREVAPNGVDCYFDNVGGETSSIVIHQMNTGGRIAVCGAITTYNTQGDFPKATMIQSPVLIKCLEMKGFYVNQFLDRWDDGILQNLKWIREGKLKYRETVTEGFENTAKAFIGVLKGENTGKAVVKV